MCLMLRGRNSGGTTSKEVAQAHSGTLLHGLSDPEKVYVPYIYIYMYIYIYIYILVEYDRILYMAPSVWFMWSSR